MYFNLCLDGRFVEQRGLGVGGGVRIASARQIARRTLKFVVKVQEFGNFWRGLRSNDQICWRAFPRRARADAIFRTDWSGVGPRPVLLAQGIIAGTYRRSLFFSLLGASRLQKC